MRFTRISVRRRFLFVVIGMVIRHFVRTEQAHRIADCVHQVIFVCLALPEFGFVPVLRSVFTYFPYGPCQRAVMVVGVTVARIIIVALPEFYIKRVRQVFGCEFGFDYFSHDI